MVVINHLEWGDGELANQISLWNFPFGLTYGLTYGQTYGLNLRAHLRANLWANLRAFYGLTYGLGFWALIHVVGRKCHIGVSWRGAHMMGSLTGSLTGQLTGSLTGFLHLRAWVLGSNPCGG